jgi:hypothetical protein
MLAKLEHQKKSKAFLADISKFWFKVEVLVK